MKKTSFILTLLLCCAFLPSYILAADAAQVTPASSFDIDGKVLCKFTGSETEVVIPEGVTKIDECAFSRCDSLKSVVIPEGVKIIGDHAFFICDSLTSVAIPDSVKKIGTRAFSACPALKEWIISPTHPHFKTDGTGLLTKDGKKLLACLNSAKEYRIPDGVTKIAYGAFLGCESLTSVVIPEGVTKIGDSAFCECTSLKSVVIPKGVKEIGEDAFCCCYSLTSLVLPEGVTKIGDAFGGCESLTSVVVPDTVKEIEIRTFSGCTAMKEWGISPTNPYFKSDGPALLTKDGKKLLSCLYWAKEYRIPDGVTTIEAYAFVGRDSLTSVVIPESVREIGQSAFLGCNSLKSVVIPNGVQLIWDYAFRECRSLTSVEIPESVTEIWYGAFLDCPNLTIHAPKGSYAEKYAKEHGIPFEAK